MITTPPTDAQLLTFEGQFFHHHGAKVTAIRDQLGQAAPSQVTIE